MSRLLMVSRCPGARALGIARLSGWRFVINPEGFGSLAPRAGGRVLGVVWRLTARDLAAVNAYESVASGLYRRRQLQVRWMRCDANAIVGAKPRQSTTTALVYIASRQGEGIPRPGYIAMVVEAARDWELPDSYIRSLMRWSPSAWHGVHARDTGQLG